MRKLEKTLLGSLCALKDLRKLEKPEITQEHSRELEITREHLRELERPEITQEHLRELEITQEHLRELTLKRTTTSG